MMELTIITREMGRLTRQAGSISICLLVGISIFLLSLGIWLRGVASGGWVLVSVFLIAGWSHSCVSTYYISAYSQLARQRLQFLSDAAKEAEVLEHQIELALTLSLLEVRFSYFQLFASWCIYSIMAAVSLIGLAPGFGFELISVGVIFVSGILGMMVTPPWEARSVY